MENKQIDLVIITGMSGAGKTVAMQSLEDANFYCVDNLPPQLMTNFSTIIKTSAKEIDKVALAIDLRTIDFLEALPKVLEELKKIKGINYKMVFLDATDEVLVGRYELMSAIHDKYLSYGSCHCR